MNRMEELEKLKYPIGRFKLPKLIDAKHISDWIRIIEVFPTKIQALTAELSQKQLLWCYRPDGWNIAQVVHHCADSHMNSFIRFKLSLTENEPVIKPYHEDRWANLVDGNSSDLAASYSILSGVHARWVLLLNALNEDDLSREYIHPEHGKRFRLDTSIGIYAWHCNHHLAHIKQAINNEGF